MSGLSRLTSGGCPPPPPRKIRMCLSCMPRAIAFFLMVRQQLPVPAGAERVACSGDDPGIDRGIETDISPAGPQLDIGVGMQRVTHLGSIDGDISDMLFFLVDDVLQILGHR